MANRSQWKNQFFHYEHASKAHNALRKIFCEDNFFKQLKCFQEVLVSDLVTSYPNNFDAVDWYIDELNTVIELHGKQHYEMQSFGSSDSYFNQVKSFNNIRYRDNRKKTFLKDSGYNYLEVPYTQKITVDFIKSEIFKE